MWRRLRDLIQLPLTLYRVQTLVSHQIRLQEETNRRLAELHIGLIQRPSAVTFTPPIDPATLADPSPEIPLPPVKQRPRTADDVVVASRDVLLESQLRREAAALAEAREGHPIR